MATSIYVDEGHSSVFTLKNVYGEAVTGYANSLTVSVYDNAFALDATTDCRSITGVSGAYRYAFTPDAEGTWIAYITDNQSYYNAGLQSFKVTASSGSQLETVEDYHWQTVSMINTIEAFLWNPVNSKLDTLNGFTDQVESQLDTQELYHWDTVSMLNTQEDYHWVEVSMLNTVEDYVHNPLDSKLDTIISMNATLEGHLWAETDSQIQTAISMLGSAEQWDWDYTYSMLETEQLFGWTNLDSKLNTCQSFLLWDMVGLGTGAYYYDENGYYRNNAGTGTQVLWAAGETGVLTDSSTGDPVADMEITAFRVNGTFSAGTRYTGNRGIADQTKTDSYGKYHGYLDPGIYDFHAFKDGYIDEYIRRELTTE